MELFEKKTLEENDKLTAINKHYLEISFLPDGKIIEANKNFLICFGYELDEIIGKHHSIFCDELFVNSSRYIEFWNDLNKDISQTSEFKRIKKNGESIYIQASYTPIKDNNGNVYKIVKLAQDITERKLNNLYYQGQIDAINKSQVVIEFDLNGIVLKANKNFLITFDYELNEVIGKHHRMFCQDSYINSIEYEKFWQKLNEGKFDKGEYLRVAKNGRIIWIQASYNPIFNIDGKLIKIVKFAQDITQEKLSSLYYTGQIEAINKSQSVIEFDMNGNILKANENFLKTMGYEYSEIKDKHHNIFCEDNYKNSDEYNKFWEILNKGIFQSGKYLRIGKNGKKVWIQATYNPILDIDKKPVKVVKFSQDITQLEISKKDTLTNFFNRQKLIQDIEVNENNNLAIIDLDDFSSINDFYGYSIGDRIIIEFSDLIKKLLNEEFSLYRLYADKFAILNKNLSNKEFLEVIKNLNKEMKKLVINLDVKKFHIIPTCGISFEDKNHIFSTAEISNKYAKKISKNLLVYSKSLNIEKEFEDNIYWVEKIKTALEDDRIIVHFQPIFNNFTKKIEKYEALVRLIDENGTTIYPNSFLNIAKKSKQYIDITKVVISKSFEKFKNSEFEFSINFTVEDILDKELNNYLIRKIKEYNIGHKLVVEIVESEKITEYQFVYDFIEKIKLYKCKVAIDDFGSGYSNFEYLIKINADYVKIDGSIIKRINEDENALEIVKSIINFAEKMKFKTIAEFVSDKEIFDMISHLGMNYSQGFYIGKPNSELITEY